MLQALYESNRGHVRALEPVLWALLEMQRTVYIVIDGLDECPEENDVREEVLEGLRAFRHRRTDIRLLVMSRKETGINDYMRELGALPVPIQHDHVDQDIRTYVSREMSRHRKLRTLDADVKSTVESTLSDRANGR